MEDNLIFHGRYFGMSGEGGQGRRPPSCSTTVRLADRAKAPVMALSGGMAQRLMVARAIMHKPQVLFLDEPTAGLDPQSRIALWEIIRELHAEGQTILLTTHYMEEADLLCDRVAIMDHGRILALDTPGGPEASRSAPTASCASTPTATSTHLADALLRQPSTAPPAPGWSTAPSILQASGRRPAARG